MENTDLTEQASILYALFQNLTETSIYHASNNFRKEVHKAEVESLEASLLECLEQSKARGMPFDIMPYFHRFQAIDKQYLIQDLSVYRTSLNDLEKEVRKLLCTPAVREAFKE